MDEAVDGKMRANNGTTREATEDGKEARERGGRKDGEFESVRLVPKKFGRRGAVTPHGTK